MFDHARPAFKRSSKVVESNWRVDTKFLTQIVCRFLQARASGRETQGGFAQLVAAQRRSGHLAGEAQIGCGSKVGRQ